MSEKIQLTISESTLEQLRCSLCKDYLSCPPVRILPSGSNICGRCSPLNKDEIAYRHFTLETVLGDATFPCKFNESGCELRLLFGSTIAHEAECSYCIDVRPKSPKADCSMEKSDEVIKKRANSELGDDKGEVKVVGKKEEVSEMNDSRVLNPCSISSRSSNTPSLVRRSNWNRNYSSSTSGPPPQSNNNWNRNFHNFDGTNGNNYSSRNWGGNRRFHLNKRTRENSVVVIKGHTLHVQL